VRKWSAIAYPFVLVALLSFLAVPRCAAQVGQQIFWLDSQRLLKLSIDQPNELTAAVIQDGHSHAWPKLTAALHNAGLPWMMSSPDGNWLLYDSFAGGSARRSGQPAYFATNVNTLQRQVWSRDPEGPTCWANDSQSFFVVPCDSSEGTQFFLKNGVMTKIKLAGNIKGLIGQTSDGRLVGADGDFGALSGPSIIHLYFSRIGATGFTSSVASVPKQFAIVSLGYEPRANRLAIVAASRSKSSASKTSCFVYDLDQSGAVLKQTSVYADGKPYDNIEWSPDGSKFLIFNSSSWNYEIVSVTE
jgi:hypothetical protein